MLQQLALHAPFQHEKNAQKGKGKSSHGNYQEQHCMFFSGLPARRQVQKRLKQVLLRDKKFNFKSYIQNYYVKCITFGRLHLIQNQIKSHKIQSLAISFYLWIHSRCIRLILQNTCIHQRYRHHTDVPTHDDIYTKIIQINKFFTKTNVPRERCPPQTGNLIYIHPWLLYLKNKGLHLGSNTFLGPVAFLDFKTIPPLIQY